MKIVALTDIHGSVKFLKDIIPYLKNSDLTVIAGDITNFGDGYDAERVLAPIRDYSNELIAVFGNCDYPTVEKYLEEEKISLSWKWKRIKGYTFVGLGGSLSCPAKTPGEYPEDRYRSFLESVQNVHSTDKNGLILITHEPPKGTKCDKTMGGRHVGSDTIRSFVEKVQPVLVVTGHIHEGRSIDKIGKSVIVNPGPFKSGNFSIIALDNSDVNVILKP